MKPTPESITRIKKALKSLGPVAGVLAAIAIPLYGNYIRNARLQGLGRPSHFSTP